MYSVVVCPDCKYSWIVDGRPGRTGCGQCGKSHQFKKLRALHTSESREECARARAAVLAQMGENDEMFERAVESGIFEEPAGVDDDSYLEAMGVSPEELDAVEESATSQQKSGLNQRETIEKAIKTQDAPSRSEVLEFTTEHGLSREKAESMLEKMIHRGVVAEVGGGLRFV